MTPGDIKTVADIAERIGGMTMITVIVFLVLIISLMQAGGTIFLLREWKSARIRAHTLSNEMTKLALEAQEREDRLIRTIENNTSAFQQLMGWLKAGAVTGRVK